MAAAGSPSRPRTNFWSTIPFLFLNKVITKLAKNGDDVTPGDLAVTAATDIEPQVAHSLFLVHWHEELALWRKGGKPSLLRALRRTFISELLFAAVLKLIWGALIVLCASYFIRALLAWLQSKNRREGVPDEDGWILSCFLFLACFTLSIALQQMANVSSRLGLRVRAAMCTAVYQKSLVEDRTPKSIDVVSLVATDCSKLHEATATLNYLWSAIVEALAIIGVLLGLVGVSALPGACW
jgi:ATP-binding cassette, subfamily C (CFTR/MRP), member 1